MKNSKYLFTGLVLSILLLAAGCNFSPLAEQPNDVAIADAASTPPQTVDLKQSWWLTFTLPTGWVETTQLGGTDKPEYEPMTRDNPIVIVNTTKFFWPSSGRGPDWINQSDVNNIADQATATGITVSKITTDIPKTAKLISGNLYRDQVCNKGEDCQIGGSWIYVYYLKMPNGIFEAYVAGSDTSAQMVEVVEGILESAKSVDLASPATESMSPYTIKEFGITFDIPTKYKDDLAYELSHVDSMVWMYSKSVAQKEKLCKGGFAGSIIKGKKPYNLMGEERDPDPRSDIKVGDMYITINGPQDICTQDKELWKTLEDLTKALRSALPTVRANEVTDTTLAPEDMTGWKTVITYPTNGSIIEGRIVKIKGTAKPNSYIWAFVTTTPPGEREADRSCLSGGVPGSDQGSDAQTDSKGNFEFTLKEPCSKNVWIYVASEDQVLGEVLYNTKGGWKGLCQSDSDRINFTLSGELPTSCK